MLCDPARCYQLIASEFNRIAHKTVLVHTMSKELEQQKPGRMPLLAAKAMSSVGFALVSLFILLKGSTKLKGNVFARVFWLYGWIGYCLWRGRWFPNCPFFIPRRERSRIEGGRRPLRLDPTLFGVLENAEQFPLGRTHRLQRVTRTSHPRLRPYAKPSKSYQIRQSQRPLRMLMTANYLLPRHWLLRLQSTWLSSNLSLILATNLWNRMARVCLVDLPLIPAFLE